MLRVLRVSAEWRFTRPARYPTTSPGGTDPSARQGYYMTAPDAATAERRARAEYGIPPGERLDVEQCREHDEPIGRFA